jgi:hypothetical protein
MKPDNPSSRGSWPRTRELVLGYLRAGKSIDEVLVIMDQARIDRPHAMAIVQEAVKTLKDSPVNADEAWITLRAAINHGVQSNGRTATVANLMKAGFSKDAAIDLVMHAQEQRPLLSGPPPLAQVLNRGQRTFEADRQKRKMLWGLALLVGGLIVTSLTYLSASVESGTYYLCYGAMLFGAFNFLTGLTGWLSNK